MDYSFLNPINNANLVIDVGAADGREITYFKSLWPHVHVVAVEPRLRWHSFLQDTELIKAAVASYSGETVFYESLDPHPYSSSIRRPTGHYRDFPDVKFEDQPISVPCLTLDEIANGRDPDLIWADIQGAERDMIEGGRDTFSRCRYLYTEFSNFPWYEGQWDLNRILKELNSFKVVHMDSMNVLLRNERLI